MSDDRETDTWDMEIQFKPRSHVGGSPWLLMEQLEDPPLPILDEGFLGLEFYEGVTPDKAREIAALLDEHVQFVTYTGPVKPEYIDQPGRGAVARRRRKYGSKPAND